MVLEVVLVMIEIVAKPLLLLRLKNHPQYIYIYIFIYIYIMYICIGGTVAGVKLDISVKAEKPLRRTSVHWFWWSWGWF